MNENMEEFSLDKYNTGDYDVVTRDGKEVRVLCIDKKCRVSITPIVALVSHVSCSKNYELVQVFCQDGKIHMFEENDNDLMLVKKKWKPEEGQRYWYVDSTNMTVRNSIFYLSTKHNNRLRNNNCFKTEEEAKVMSEKFKQLLRDE